MDRDSSSVSPSEAPAASKPAKTPKGEMRIAEILEIALKVLAEDGQAGLTLERVAQGVGIRKGNLQYYFRSRDDLLRAVLARQIEVHRRQWKALYADTSAAPLDRLRRLIEFEVAMNRDKVFVAQVRERWALVERDDGARALTNEWLEEVTGYYARLIAEIRPDLDSKSCRQLAIMIYSMLVGSLPFFGRNRAAPRWTGALDRRMEAAILDLILAAGPGKK